VPFSLSRYFIYKRNIARYGSEGIKDRRSFGNNTKLTAEIKVFLQGYITNIEICTLDVIQREIETRFGVYIGERTLSKIIAEIGCKNILKKGRPEHSKEYEEQINSIGGFELIVAMAYHLGWPERIEKIISQEITKLKRRKIFSNNADIFDLKCRNKDGTFTKRYNARKDVRTSRFKSISDKIPRKNFQSMNIISDSSKTIERKNIAMLSLPVITMNGSIRTINAALGEALVHFCGFNYKQSTLTKHLSELKYLEISSLLLKELASFWRDTWAKNTVDSMTSSLLCYYIDGNTKALWSSRVKKSKVTMLGRVMGCLEQVFIHDNLGNPIYFETYAGHAPSGEYILSMFKKVEEVILDVPHSRTVVNRAIVMDGGHNSVGTLRSFSEQDQYYYITTLDDNQWNEQNLFVSKGRPQCYKYGDATLSEVTVELKDSKEKNYLFQTRGIKTYWLKTNKTTVLLTNLPRNLVDANEVTYSYFRRWPCQELKFKEGKAVASIHHVAGYGKIKVDDKNVQQKQKKTEKIVSSMEEVLSIPIEKINRLEQRLAGLVLKENAIKLKSTVNAGKRIIPEELQEKSCFYGKRIRKIKREIKKTEDEHKKEFRKLKKHRREWMRLQGKEHVYKIDVELDQIVTFYRMSLANLYAYFIKEFLGGEPISMMMLLNRVIHLQGKITENSKIRYIELQYNKKDISMMDKLQEAIQKINCLKIKGNNNKTMFFSLSKI
jgi:transposase